MIYPIVFFELCLVVSTLVIMIICGIYYGGISMEFVLRQFPAASILINILFYGASIFVLGRAYKRDNLRFGERNNRWSVGKMIAAAVIAAAAAVALNAAILYSPLPDIFPGFNDAAATSFKGQNPILLILTMVILGPIAEELAFRGLTYDRMKRYLGVPWSIVISSLMFGIYHANMIQFIYTSIMGLLLALYYEKSGSLIVPVIAHMAMNAYAVASYF